MSRAQQAQVQNQGNTLLSTESANANAANPTAGYQAIVNNPGYTPAQQTAITQATTGGVGAAFGAANEGAANTAARTNNAAGLTSQQDALARQRMITSGNLAAQNQETFANDAQQQRLAALGGLNSVFGTSTGAANSTLGTLAGNAKTPSFWDQFGNTVAGSLGNFGVNAGPGGVSGGFG